MDLPSLVSNLGGNNPEEPIKYTVQSLKSSKALGLDGLPSFYNKILLPTITPYIEKYCNRMPPEFYMAQVAIIPKSKQDPAFIF